MGCKMKKVVFSVWLLLCLIWSLFAQVSNDFSDNKVLVVLTPETSEYNTTLDESFFGDFAMESVVNLSLIYNEKAIEALKEQGREFRSIYQITLPTHDKAKVLETIESLNKTSGVEYATPDYFFHADLIPNDTYLDLLWGLNDTHGIKAPQAWDISTGSHAIRVGVIDSGIANHPDLDANVTTGYDFFHSNTTTTDDTIGHGTKVAGVIGAVGNNSLGVVGVNWDVTIVPLQAINNTNTFPNSFLVSAINRATNTWGTPEQISVLNHSISGYGQYYYDTRLMAINNYPGLFIWSAGNGGEDFIGDDVDTAYIENYHLDNIMAVGALTSDGQKSGFSNYSSSGEYVQIYAPGSNIYSTRPSNEYGADSGTSLSAPYVTGVVALLLSVNPCLSARQLIQMIVESADPLTIDTPHGEQIVNRLNAYTAVQLASSLPYLTISPSDYYFGEVAMTQTSPEQTFTISLANTGYSIMTSITKSGAGADNFTLRTNGLPYMLNTGEIYTFTVSFAPTSLGQKSATINIYSTTSETPQIIWVSGTGISPIYPLPYTQHFDTANNLSSIGWDSTLSSTIASYSGVNSSRGLVFTVSSSPTYASTPTISDITLQSYLSIAYRIVQCPTNWNEPLTATTLGVYDKLYVEVSTTGGIGTFTPIYEINHINHSPATMFTTLELPLSDYSSESVNIRFRAVKQSGGFCALVIDDVVIRHSIYTAPESFFATLEANNVILHWTLPLGDENLLGFLLYRNTTLLDSLPATTLNFSDENLARGQYTYTIRASYIGGLSIPKSVVVNVPNIVPYIESFDQCERLADIDWAVDSFYYSTNVFPRIGVNDTKGLVFQMWTYEGNSRFVYTPTIVGITPETTLSFSYRIIDDLPFSDAAPLPMIASELTENDKIYIDVSTTGGTGSYTQIHEINQTNHALSLSFATWILPLSAFTAQPINIRFRLVSNNRIIYFIFDDVCARDDVALGAPQNLVATLDSSRVELCWQAPENDTLLGYRVYRNRMAQTGIITTRVYTDETVVGGVNYTYYISAIYPGAIEVASQSLSVTLDAIASFDEIATPSTTTLQGNYPNPFNPETTIQFSLKQTDRVSIDIFSIKGQLVRSLVNGIYGVGLHKVVWNGCDGFGRPVSSGVYFYRMSTSEYTGVRKMLLLK